MAGFAEFFYLLRAAQQAADAVDSSPGPIGCDLRSRLEWGSLLSEQRDQCLALVRFVQAKGDEIAEALLAPAGAAPTDPPAREEPPPEFLRAFERDNMLRAAHRRSRDNRGVFARRCGCFHCLKEFPPEDILSWIDGGETALCPHCGVDAVIPLRDGLPEDILPTLRKRHFAHTARLPPRFRPPG